MDTGAAVGQGEVKELRRMETYKKQKNRHQCLFLFRNNVGLNHNNANYRKPI